MNCGFGKLGKLALEKSPTLPALPLLPWGTVGRMGPLATATTHSWRLALDLTEGWILGRVSTVTGRYRGPASPDSDALRVRKPSRGSGRPLPQQFPEQIYCLFESGNNRLQTPQGPRDPATGSSCPSLLWQNSMQVSTKVKLLRPKLGFPTDLRPTQTGGPAGNQASHWAVCAKDLEFCPHGSGASQSLTAGSS